MSPGPSQTKLSFIHVLVSLTQNSPGACRMVGPCQARRRSWPGPQNLALDGGAICRRRLCRQDVWQDSPSPGLLLLTRSGE